MGEWGRGRDVSYQNINRESEAKLSQTGQTCQPGDGGCWSLGIHFEGISALSLLPPSLYPCLLTLPLLPFFPLPLVPLSSHPSFFSSQ